MQLTSNNIDVQRLLDEPRDILLVGMSGIGKTLLSNYLNQSGKWQYVSVDAQIQGKFLRKQILDVFNAEVRKGPMLSKLHEMGVLNLENELDKVALGPLTSYLGMPGDPDRGGIDFGDYVERQNFHLQAERAAVEELIELDCNQPVLADSSGSFCEWLTADDPTFAALRERFVIVSLRENDALVQNLIARYAESPKPIYYPPELLFEYWETFSAAVKDREGRSDVDPVEFALWSYEKLVAARRQKYAALAECSEVIINAAELQYA